MSRASIITAVGSNELGRRIKSDQVIKFCDNMHGVFYGMKRRARPTARFNQPLNTPKTVYKTILGDKNKYINII